MTTKVTEVKVATAKDTGPVGVAFSIPEVTAVRVGIRKEDGRIYYGFSATRYSKGWSVRDERKVTSRRLAEATVQKKVQKKVAALKAEGVAPEKIVVVGHRREARP